MDKFEAYLSAIELVPPPTNIRIAFLSKNLRYIAVPATRSRRNCKFQALLRALVVAFLYSH